MKSAGPILRAWALIALATAFCAAQSGSDTQTQFWPEIQVLWKISPDMRLMVNDSATKTQDQPYSNNEVGIHLDFLVPRFKPRLFLRTLNMNDERMRTIVLRIGYRYQHSA